MRASCRCAIIPERWEVRFLMRTALIAGSCLALLTTGPAFAWDSFGHMTVAAVAWQHLDAAAKQKAAALLKRNPDYDTWTKGVAEARRDETAFIRAAIWPDDIKTDDHYTDDGDTVDGPKAARNVGYADILRHRYWHYINFPFSPDNTPLKEPVVPNIQTQIHAFRLKLASASASAALKSYDLAWLIHLVGDAHQPLHSTARFTKAAPDGDRGGQGVSTCPSACTQGKQNLHVVWDDALGTDTSVASARTAGAALPAPDAAAAAIDDEKAWLDESFALAQSDVYQSPIGDGAGPYVLTASYKANAKKLAQERVALAGVRLAHLINEALD